jgi:hypothetical protein
LNWESGGYETGALKKGNGFSTGIPF